MFRFFILIGFCFLASCLVKAANVIGYTVLDADAAIISDISAIYTPYYGSSVGVYSTIGLNGGIADNVTITSVGALYDGGWDTKGVSVTGSSSAYVGLGNIAGTINATSERGISAGLYFYYVTQAEGKSITSNIYAQSQYDYDSYYSYGIYSNKSVLRDIGTAESEIIVSARGAKVYGIYSTGSGSAIGAVNGNINVTSLHASGEAYGISALDVGNIVAQINVHGAYVYGISVNNFGNISGSIEVYGGSAYAINIDSRYYLGNGVISGRILAQGTTSACAVNFLQGGGTLHLSGNASITAVCENPSSVYAVRSYVYSIAIDGDENRQSLTGNILSARDLTITSGNFDFYSDSWQAVGNSAIGSLDSSTSVGFFDATTITSVSLEITNAELNFHANTEVDYGKILLATSAVIDGNSSINLYLDDYFRSGVNDFNLLIIDESSGLLTMNEGYTVNLLWNDGSSANDYFDWNYLVDDSGLAVNLIGNIPEASSCAFVLGMFSLFCVFYCKRWRKAQKD